MLAVKLGSAGEGGAGVSEAEGGEYEGSVPAGGAAVVSTCMLAVEGGEDEGVGARSAPPRRPLCLHHPQGQALACAQGKGAA